METTAKQNKLVKWLRRLGFWGFMFFLAKGLVWLVVGYFVARQAN